MGHIQFVICKLYATEVKCGHQDSSVLLLGISMVFVEMRVVNNATSSLSLYFITRDLNC